MKLKVVLVPNLLLGVLILYISHISTTLGEAGISPSFVRQEVVDDDNDWNLWRDTSNNSLIITHSGHRIEVPYADNLSQCQVNNKYPSPNIRSVSYVSDGTFLNTTLWLSQPEREPSTVDTVDEYQEKLDLLMANTNKSLQEYTNFNRALFFSPMNPVKFVENDTALSGVKAHQFIFYTKQGDLDLKILKIWTIDNGRLYEMTYTAEVSKYDKDLPIAKKIIDSFFIKGLNRNAMHTSVDKNYQTYHDNIVAFQYPSDWSIKKTPRSGVVEIIVTSPFEDKSNDEISWHEKTYTMAIDVDSVHDTGTDYRIILSRVLHDSSAKWMREVREISAFDESKLLENSTYPDTLKTNPYVLFSFDLAKANYPERSKIVLYITDFYVKNHQFCRLIDTTNWVIVPPPKFFMSLSPSAVFLRSGQDENVQIRLKGNSDLPSNVHFVANSSNSSDIKLKFISDKTAIPPSGSGETTLNVKVPENVSISKAKQFNIPIYANISFPASVSNRGGETFSNSKGVSIKEAANFTLNLLPPLTFEENLNNISTNWISPLNTIWTFVAGIGTVMAPLILILFRRKYKRHNKQGD